VFVCLFVVFRYLVVVRSIKWPGRVRVYVARNPHPVICFSEDFVIKSRRFSCHCGYSDQISLAVYYAVEGLETSGPRTAPSAQF